MSDEKITIEGKLTLESVLNKIKDSISNIEPGQVYETVRSIYPDESVPSYKKNIEFNDVRMTLPLASSLKAKREYCKTDSSLKSLFKENKKGDILIVEEVHPDYFICKNLSIDPNVYKDIYKNPEMKKVKLTKEDIAFGNIRRVYRGLKSLNIGD